MLMDACNHGESLGNRFYHAVSFLQCFRERGLEGPLFNPINEAKKIGSCVGNGNGYINSLRFVKDSLILYYLRE